MTAHRARTFFVASALALVMALPAGCASGDSPKDDPGVDQPGDTATASQTDDGGGY